jgi:hypothetical protein
MDFKNEIAREVEKLPPNAQNRVLQFVTSLAAAAHGTDGATLCQFAFSIDTESAQQMTNAIEEECERVDAKDW